MLSRLLPTRTRRPQFTILPRPSRSGRRSAAAGTWPDNADQVDRLLRAAAARTGPDRRDRLDQAVIAAMPLALRAAEQYRERAGLAELYQIAALALVKAASSYLEDTRGAFAVHAAPMVHAQIRRHLENRPALPVVPVQARAEQSAAWDEVLPVFTDLPATARQILALNLVGGLHASRIGRELGLPQSYVDRVIGDSREARD